MIDEIENNEMFFIICLLSLCFVLIVIHYSLVYEAFRTRVLQGLLVLLIATPLYLLGEYIDYRMRRIDEDE